METPSKLSRFATIVYHDINNGCGSRRFTPVEWKKHFEEHHTDSAGYLISALAAAYTQYMLSHKEMKRTL